MKRVFAVLLTLTLLLSGCQAQPQQIETTQPTAGSAAQPTAEPTTEPTVPPTTQPQTELTTEPPLLYTNPLTGEPCAEPVTQRPVAVVINNIRQAQPLHGISQAQILYEITAEGGGTITRLLGIFTDVSEVEKVGSIRSARTYLIDLARAHNAILVHCGGSEYAYSELQSSGWARLDQTYNGSYFYRDTARKNAGYATEHTLFANGAKLMEGILSKNYTMTDDRQTNVSFTEDAAPANGEAAATVTLQFSSGGKQTVMTYDETEGVYKGEQRFRNSQGKLTITEPLADANTGETVGYENLIVLRVRTTTDGYRMFTDQVGSGEGWFACGGRIVPILWSRESTDSQFVYTLTDGTPLTLGIGKTYVGILSNSAPFSYE